MIRHFYWINVVLLNFFLALAANASTDPRMVEAKTKSDLEEAISRLIARDRFFVQVSANTDTVSQRQLAEGETVTISSPGSEVVVPPLPGFQAQAAPSNPQGQTRQVFKMVEKDVLKSVAVQLGLDETLAPELAAQIRDLANNYVGMQFGSKGAISVTN